ncbi:MAG: aspartate carbamoyltransferase regulatory subunit [Lachnospiraceae bacterium]|nr:aspartate carbamoyltransferase regulatory subunit [Lachnospiraceae bacterium]
MLNIGGLNQGIVIDHIPAGEAMQIYEYLNLGALDCEVAIIKNASSKKMGRKDIIKIEGPLTINIDALAVRNPNVTINIIENDVIVAKRPVTLPSEVKNIIKCKNPRCITSLDLTLPHMFKLTNKENSVYRCVYCEEAYKRERTKKA